MHYSTFAVIEIHTDFNNEKPIQAWRILEKYKCFDGFRTRICDQAYNSKEEALEHLNRYFAPFFELTAN